MRTSEFAMRYRVEGKRSFCLEIFELLEIVQCEKLFTERGGGGTVLLCKLTLTTELVGPTKHIRQSLLPTQNLSIIQPHQHTAHPSLTHTNRINIITSAVSILSLLRM